MALSRPRLFIVCGLSFAGKSTVGRAISKTFGLPQVDVDETKIRLHGADLDDDQLTPKQWAAIYAETDEEIAAFLTAGESVVDASRYFKKSERDRARVLTKSLHAGIITVYVDTLEAVARERWQENRRTRTRRDISDAAFQEIIDVMEPPTAEEHPVIYHFTDDLDRWLADLSDRMSV